MLTDVTSALPRWFALAGETPVRADLDLLYGGVRAVSAVMEALQSSVA